MWLLKNYNQDTNESLYKCMFCGYEWLVNPSTCTDLPQYVCPVCNNEKEKELWDRFIHGGDSNEKVPVTDSTN